MNAPDSIGMFVASAAQPLTAMTQRSVSITAASWDFFVARESHPANDSTLPHVGRHIQGYLRDSVAEDAADMGR